jgi:hypothetical protein
MGSPNKRMQLTKLRAAPVRRAEVPPCAPAGETDGAPLRSGSAGCSTDGKLRGVETA